MRASVEQPGKEPTMRVEVDPVFKKNVGDVFGAYVGTLKTPTVRVDVFQRGSELIAYVAAEGKTSAFRAVAPHLDELTAFAEEFSGKLRLIYT